MISTGQLIFAVVFVIVFVTILVISYKRDRPLHRKYYKGIIWKILVGFLAFMGLMLLAKYLLK